MRPLLFLFALCFILPLQAQESVEHVLSELDAVISRREVYIKARESRIEDLKDLLNNNTNTPLQRYNIISRIIGEYTPYQADSTIAYLNRNIVQASRMEDTRRLNESRISLSLLYSLSGSYLEAEKQLQKVDTLKLDHALRLDYYIACHKLNDELKHYSHDTEQAEASSRKCEYYNRMILENTAPDTFAHLDNRLWKALNENRYKEAEKYADKLCSMCPPLSHEYAKAGYMRALIAALQDDTPTARIWYARSAMTDIQLAIRDNASLKNLAHSLLDDDIRRSMNYMRTVMDDARFFNSRLRPWQDAEALHMIEQAYLKRQQHLRRIYIVLGVTIILFLLLAIEGFFYSRRQNRKLTNIKHRLMKTCDCLNASNEELKSTNIRLEGLNNRICEANEVKEEYIAVFLMMCSEYIDKISESRRHVRRLLRDGQVAELKKEYATTDTDTRELEQFYSNFDNTFLLLYPSFIEEFNALLEPDARIEPKKGELLTTELRIFALIRLGITDSSKIATLLRYSVSTIYNYRSKIKTHALISRDEFEKRIHTIGSFSSRH